MLHAAPRGCDERHPTVDKAEQAAAFKAWSESCGRGSEGLALLPRRDRHGDRLVREQRRTSQLSCIKCRMNRASIHTQLRRSMPKQHR